MSDEERALRAVRCESPDDPVVRIRGDDGRFLVDLASGDGRQVTLPRTTDEDARRYRRHGFEIINMFDLKMPPMGVLGVALFDDGEACRLNDKPGLVRFYRRASAAFEPLAVANLLLLYQTFGFPRVAADLAVFDRFELSRPVTELPGFTLPRLEGDELEFWSYSAGPIGTTSPESVELLRWRVTGLSGDLDWEQTHEATIRANAPGW
jgi:hypothetical protein